MRLTPGDIASLPLSCALFDRQGRLLQATPEWQGFSLGALTYDAGVGSLVVVPDGCSPDLDSLVTELIADVAAAAPALRRADRMAVEMLAAALALVAGRGAPSFVAGTVADVVDYVTEGVRRTVPGARLEVQADAKKAEIASPPALALALVQLVRNAVSHAGAADVRLHIRRGPTFAVEWLDPDSSGAAVGTSRRPDQRQRWGLGYARLLADALGGVLTAPGPRGDGYVVTSIGLGSPRLSAAVATVVHGRVERATRAWDEETELPPGSPLDVRVQAAVTAAQAMPGQIAYADIFRARAGEARTWLAVAPPSSMGRARDVLRGLQHENALLSAPEPGATRIFALASALACALSGEPPEAVPASTWERDFGPACVALGVVPPTLNPDRLRYPEPRLTAYLMAVLDGRLVDGDPRLELAAGVARTAHPLVRMLGGRDGLVVLVS